MTDRELLELAAKAAGYSLTKGSSGYCEFLCKGGVEWNPLDDDGNALRLAVDLGIDVSFFEGSVEADHESFTLARSMPYGTDKRAATRRAIVRAAAAIEISKEHENVKKPEEGVI